MKHASQTSCSVLDKVGTPIQWSRAASRITRCTVRRASAWSASMRGSGVSRSTRPN